MSVVRKYEGSDVEAVLSVWESTQELAHPFLPDDFQNQEKRNIRGLYLPNVDTWVVEDNNHVVGFIALIGNEIGGLFVRPTHHGRKLGKLLVDKANELHGELTVEVFAKNLIGRQFYSKYGFTMVEEKVHEETGEPLLYLKFVANKLLNSTNDSRDADAR